MIIFLHLKEESNSYNPENIPHTQHILCEHILLVPFNAGKVLLGQIKRSECVGSSWMNMRHVTIHMLIQGNFTQVSWEIFCTVPSLWRHKPQMLAFCQLRSELGKQTALSNKHVWQILHNVFKKEILLNVLTYMERVKCTCLWSIQHVAFYEHGASYLTAQVHSTGPLHVSIILFHRLRGVC